MTHTKPEAKILPLKLWEDSAIQVFSFIVDRQINLVLNYEGPPNSYMGYTGEKWSFYVTASIGAECVYF